LRNAEKRRRLWLSTSDWTRGSMLNIARMAWFSSDRTIGEYAQDIWKVPFELPSKREQEFRPSDRNWNSVSVLIEGKTGGFATSEEFLCYV
jgi:hypothetical protein